MKIKKIAILSMCMALTALPANANWQYTKYKNSDSGAYKDDGGRLTLSLRGGASMGSSGMENKLGALDAYYYQFGSGDAVASALFCINNPSACSADPVASGNLGDLAVVNDFSSTSFVAGVGIGWTMPNSPQWRVELGWDTVLESEYNAAPMFSGEVPLYAGGSVPVESTGVTSSMSTTVVSVMGYYDFYDGIEKPMGQLIPYVGIGAGYADSVTELILSDLYGDLSIDADMGNYGDRDSVTGLITFDKSEKNTVNVAALGAVGFSYGIMENTFFDMSVRVMYVPEVEWSLVNEEIDKERDIFSAKGLLYTNFMVGVRFEF